MKSARKRGSREQQARLFVADAAEKARSDPGSANIILRNAQQCNSIPMKWSTTGCRCLVAPCCFGPLFDISFSHSFFTPSPSRDGRNCEWQNCVLRSRTCLRDCGLTSAVRCPRSAPLWLFQIALQAALAKAQLADTAHRISERNAVEVVLKLIELKKVQVSR